MSKYSREIDIDYLEQYKDIREMEIPCFTREAAIEEYGKEFLINGVEYFVKGIEQRGSLNWLKLIKIK